MKPILLALFAALGITVCACSANSPSVPASPAPPSPASSDSAPASVSPAAAAAPSPTAPPADPAPAQASAAPGCLTRYLNISASTSGSAAGSAFATIVFKNLYTQCTLYGFPGVSQADGTPVVDVGQPSTENSATARELVTLQPGGYAYATLRIADASNFPASECTPVSSQWLYVIPPNQSVPLPVYFSSTACKGSASLLSVTAVRPGTGS